MSHTPSLQVQLTINKEEDTGLVDERCHLLKLIGAEPHMHFDLDVAHTGMSPEFQEKVEKSKQRLEKARIAVSLPKAHVPFCFCFSLDAISASAGFQIARAPASHLILAM